MKKYISYKDSGIKWLGDIPKNWTLTRLTNTSATITGFPFKSDNYSNNSSHIKLVRGINVKEGVLSWKDLQYWKAITPSIEKYLLKENDIVVQMDGSKVGKNYALIQEKDLPLLLVQRVTRIRFKKNFFAKYFYYHFASSGFFHWVSIRKSDPMVPHISLKDIDCFSIPCPELKEQEAIAEYLDTNTKILDNKIRLFEGIMLNYKDLRKSLINQVVTKGLDKNVKLKDGEVGFKVNENWIVYRLKDLGNLFSGLSGKSGDDFNQDDNINNKGFIPFTNIANNTYLKKNHLGTVVIEEGEKQNAVQKGDVFFLMSSEGYEDIGKTSVLAEDIEETYLNSFCKGYRVNQNKCNPYFLNYLMLSDYYRQKLLIEGKGFTRINLKMEKINDFTVYIPDSLAEQEEIVNYLDSKTNLITSIISNIESQIFTLKELRKTLINDVVTGKIKVVE